MRITDRNSFDQLVNQHDTDKHEKGLDSWNHLVAMLFMHFVHVDTLRVICPVCRHRQEHRTFEVIFKQLIKVKSLVWTAANAVRIEMWCALTSIVVQIPEKQVRISVAFVQLGQFSEDEPF